MEEKRCVASVKTRGHVFRGSHPFPPLGSALASAGKLKRGNYGVRDPHSVATSRTRIVWPVCARIYGQTRGNRTAANAYSAILITIHAAPCNGWRADRKRRNCRVGTLAFKVTGQSVSDQRSNYAGRRVN